MKKILCVLIALMCTMSYFSASAAGISNVALNNTELVVKGDVEYAEGVNKAHIFVLKDNKSLKDLLTANDPMEVMYYADDVTVGEDGKYEISLETNEVATNNTKIIVSYNGNLSEKSLSEYTCYSSSNVYIAGNVTYVDGVDNVTITILSNDDAAVLYTDTVEVNKSNGAYAVFFTGDKEVTETSNVKISYNDVVVEERKAAKSEIIKVVDWSENWIAEANELSSQGYSVLVNLPQGKINPIEINGSTLAANNDGIVIFKGNNTTISSKTPVSYSSFKKVEDAAILGRVDEKIKDNLYALNLTEAGIEGASVTADNITNASTELYLNNKRQELSKYPNTGYKVIEGVVAGTEEKIYSYNCGDAPVTKWSSATSAIVEGYFGVDWWIEAAEIDPSNTTDGKFTLKTPVDYEINKDGGRIVYKNLLEEIDLPGEWCLNGDVIYYYMPDGVTESDKFELVVSNTPALSVQAANNLWFDGITFEGTTAKTVDINNVNNIKFTNNIFKNGNRGLVANGDNITIEKNEFLNFKSDALHYVNGGNLDTLEKSNTKIAYNYFYNASNQNHSPAVLFNCIEGCYIYGAEFSNNIVHGSKTGQGVRYQGSEFEISNNDFYNLTRTGFDAGIIYSGRSIIEVANVVKNNYIHDFGPLTTDHILGYSVNGIYIDDWMSHQKILGNLIVSDNDVNKEAISGMLTAGAYNTAIGNVVVGANKGMNFSKRDDVSMDAITSAYSTYDIVKDKSAFLEEYPQIGVLKADIDTNNEFRMINNIATDNIADGLSESQYNYSSDAFIGDNSKNDEKHHQVDASVFVDAESGNYRIKTSALTADKEYYSEYTPTENTVFGFVRPETTSSFKALYPANGATLSSGTTETMLYWEQADYADSYEYQIAEDASFTTIVARGTTTERLVDVAGLDDKTYYIRIKAINESDISGYNWYSDVTSFTVGSSAPAADYEISNDTITVNDKTATVAYTFANNAASTGTYKLLVAVYDGNTLKAVIDRDVNFSASSVNESFTFDISLTGLKVKAFLWTNTSEMKPLTQAID